LSDHQKETNNIEITESELNEQMQIRREKLSGLCEQGKNPYLLTKYPVDAFSADIIENFNETEGKIVTVAGRLMAKRIMGKASFCNIQDGKGRIQAYVCRNDIGEEEYAAFKKFDIGDIVGLKGRVFKTQMGEISIHAEEVVLLSKSLQILPEKFHGLRDQEMRYRQRYVDLIVNPEVKETFIKRSQIIKVIRGFLDERGFLEVDTPVLHTLEIGAAARPFVTHHNALDIDMYLRIAPELYLKRLVVGGFERVYEVNRNFRNEGISVRHNPEFTMLEFYMAYADYNDLMDLTEEMLRTLAQDIHGTTKIRYAKEGEEGIEIDFGQPFVRMTMVESILKYGNDVKAEELTTLEGAIAVAKRHHVELMKSWELGHVITAIFEETAEHMLLQPTFITEYPAAVSPLARRNDNNPDVTDRFEFFIGGRELANGFSELNDAEDQAERFQAQVAQKEAGDDEAMFYDADFVTALEHGMPPTAGQGIGIDRLVMLFTNSHTIRDVILFPALRPNNNK